MINVLEYSLGRVHHVEDRRVTRLSVTETSFARAHQPAIYNNNNNNILHRKTRVQHVCARSTFLREENATRLHSVKYSIGVAP